VLAVTPTALATSAAAAAAPAGTAYPRRAVCVDQVGVLGAQACARISRVLRADEEDTTDEIAVVVVHSTGGVPIETWGTGLFNHWGLGKRSKNNGILLVVAVDDRRLRIVTGSGMADRLPDGAASEIIGGTITPLFRAGRIRDGVLAGVDEIRVHLGHVVDVTNQLVDRDMAPVSEPVPAVGDPPAEPASDSSGNPIAGIFAALLLGLGTVRLIMEKLGKTEKIIFGSSTSSGSSGSSRGGGSSSGGGASGSW